MISIILIALLNILTFVTGIFVIHAIYDKKSIETICFRIVILILFYYLTALAYH